MSVPVILLCGQAGVGKDTIAKIFAEKYGFKLVAQADPIKKLAKFFYGFNDETLWGPSDKRNEIHPWWATHDGLQKLQDEKLMNDLAKKIQELAGGGHDFADIKVLGLVRDYHAKLVEFTKANGGLSARIVLQLLGTEVGRATKTTIWTNAAFLLAQEMIYEGAPGVVVTDGRFRSEVLTAKGAWGGAKVVMIKGTGVATVGAEAHASETEILTVPEHMFDAVIINNKVAGVDVLKRDIDALFNFLFPVATLKSYDFSDGSEEAGNNGYVYVLDRTDIE